ncbi:asparagine synthase (glutamine-hydrolyzing) [Pseudoalteromonas piscicida]|uniref:asparagine synthase (glutamine-hydrolyzing) n=1 Tax=Pseudoalteromonas piscicida TaxID=43662 RepID=UPI000E35B36C|nr:asparagine synthase (glutamine-hydrolyzing) [Pseudoalteromonas piscicida]AXQ99563.1 asparagine synthase (glutamine-hydrolyzing) [Pseudoalteromonas piscicida]
MCGVSAIVNFDTPTPCEKSLRLEQIALSINAISHRGPDSSSTWSNHSGNVVLGHARLEIMGGQSGAQPIHSNCGKYTAVVNGEFYDYLHIKESLAGKGYKFNTDSDSEIIVHLYSEYGVDAFSQLRGEFAFILFDHEKSEVIVVRDRFGIKPLFLYENNGCYHISSEIKGITCNIGSVEVNRERFLERSYYLGNGSIFGGINQVNPGEYIRISPKGCFSYKYYDLFKVTHQEKLIGCEREAKLEIEKALLNSVETRLVSDVDVACYLSGGLDSSIILGVASKLTGKSFEAFNIAFIDDEKFNENEQANIVAKHNNANLNTIEVNSELISDYFERAVLHNEQPIFNSNSVAKYILSEKVRESGRKVVLTGEGADEVFYGYSHFRKDLVINQRSGKEFSHVECSSREALNSITWLHAQYARSSYIAENYINADSSLISLKELESKFSDFSKSFKADSFERSPYYWNMTMLPNFVLSTLGDRMEMANSVEARLPFLDHKLADIAFKIPVELKVKERIEKYILREAMKSYLPECIYSRKKHYFESPSLLGEENSKFYSQIMDLISSSDSLGLNSSYILDDYKKSDARMKRFLEPVLIEIASFYILNSNI